MLKLFFAASVASLGILSVVACSSDTNDADGQKSPPADTSDAGGGGTVEQTSDAGAANQAQACNTLPRTFAIAPKDYYAQFESDAVAVSVISQFGYKLKAPGSDQQKRGEAVTAKVFEAYKKLYPDAVAGMDVPPRVLISEDPSFNAFAISGQVVRVKADNSLRAPWVFIFNVGIFTDRMTDDHLTMIAAHEMGHLFLRNGNRDIFQFIYYRESADEQGKIFGEYEKNDPALEKLVDNVKAVGERVGQVELKELHGVPTTIGAAESEDATSRYPRYYRILQYLYNDYLATSPQQAKCAEAKTLRVKIDQMLATHVTPDTTVVFGADLASFEATTTAYASAMSTCLAHVKGTYAQGMLLLRKKEDKLYQEHVDAIATETDRAKYLDLSKNEVDADATDPTGNLVTKILTLGSKAQDALRVLYTDAAFKYEEVREFNAEDDADEAAIRIAKIMGIDSEQLSEALFLSKKPEYVASCRAILDTGKVPKYGGAVDEHHGNCWRAYRNRKLKTALQSCPASWPK